MIYLQGHVAPFMPDTEYAASVDVRGQVCSRPLMEVIAGFARISHGDVLRIICDADAEGTITRVCVEVRGYEMLWREEAEAVVLYIRRR